MQAFFSGAAYVRRLVTSSLGFPIQTANDPSVKYLEGGIEHGFPARMNCRAGSARKYLRNRENIVGQIYISLVSTVLQRTPQTAGGNEQALGDGFHSPRRTILLQLYCSLVSQPAFLGLFPYVKLFAMQGKHSGNHRCGKSSCCQRVVTFLRIKTGSAPLFSCSREFCIMTSLPPSTYQPHVIVQLSSFFKVC